MRKNLFWTILTILFLATGVWAQQTGSGSRGTGSGTTGPLVPVTGGSPITYVTSTPGTCTTGTTFYNTSTGQALFCSATNVFQALAVTTFAGVPSGACLAAQLAVNTTTGALYTCNATVWQVVGSSTPAFSAITSGTNAAAAMVVGTGASLTVSGSGTINSTTLGGATFAAPGPIGSTTPSTVASTTTTATTSFQSPLYSATARGNNAIYEGGLDDSTASDNIVGVGVFRGGDQTAASGTGAAGAATLRPGLSTSTSGFMGIPWMEIGGFKGTTVTLWNVQLLQSATAATFNDAGVQVQNPACIAATTVNPIRCIIQGLAPVNSDNTAVVGHIFCGSQSVGGQGHDNGTGQCGSVGSTIGTVYAITGTYNTPLGSTVTATSTLPLIQLQITPLTNNAATLGGGSFANPLAIGSSTPNTGAFTTLKVGGTNLTGQLATTTCASCPINNPTINVDQGMIQLSLAAGYLNLASQPYTIQAAGNYTSTAASSPALTYKVQLCTVSGCGSGTVQTLINIVTTTLSATALSNATWTISTSCVINATGVTGNLVCKGSPGLTLDTGASIVTPDSTFADTNTATSGNIDLTAALFLRFTVAQSVAGASNSYTQTLASIR